MKLPVTPKNARDMIFRNVLSASKTYAELAWRRNQMPTPVITGIDEEGNIYTHVIDIQSNEDKPKFYKKILEDFKSKKAVIIARMAESWTLRVDGDDARDEYLEYSRNGGSLEHWEGAKEVFLSEVMDENGYSGFCLDIFRDEDGKYDSYEVNEDFNAFEGDSSQIDGVLIDLCRELWKDSD